MIKKCSDCDFDVVLQIINDAASAYKGVIPADCWHDPYMSREQLTWEIEDGVVFWGFQDKDALIGVMGIQDKNEVTLIRHAYVRTQRRNQGIGTHLLRFLESSTEKPILIGTWTAAHWAVDFYRKNGYHLLAEKEKNRLLKKYWTISERQIQTSVVLADSKWISANTSSGDEL